MKANKKTLIDYYAFSLSILACAIEEDVIKFENMVDIFIDLESKIFQARYAYKMCMIVTRDSCLPERYPFLKPCFVGNNSLICHILVADEYKLINLMKQLSTDYILNSVEYPFHSQACPLNSNSILLDNIEINLLTPIRNIFSICGQGIHDTMINMNQVFTSKITFTKKLQTYDYIGEAASRSHLISLLKDSFPGIEDNICLEVLDK